MKRLSILCLVMALFGTAVMLVGYKAPTIGLVATVAALDRKSTRLNSSHCG